MPVPLLDNRQLGTDTARQNLLTNGGFFVAQRGTGPFTANAQWPADRWQITLTGTSTMSVSQTGVNAGPGATTVSGVLGSFTFGSGGTSFCAQALKVGDFGGHTLRGRSFAASVRVFANAANAVRLRLYMDGTGGVIAWSPYHTGDNTWQTLTVVSGSVVPNDATQISLAVQLDASVSQWGMANAMLVPGTVPADYMGLHPADDLLRCLRYYELASTSTAPMAPAMAISATTALAGWFYRVPKVIAPTVTISAAGDLQLLNSAAAAIVCNGFSVVNGNQLSVDVRPAVASGLVAGNATFLYGFTANAKLIAEANP